MKLIYSRDNDASANKAVMAIAIRLKNELKSLPALISSIRSQTIYNRCKLIFLDSGSTDGSIEYLHEHADKIFSIEPSDFQFGRSCNQIVEQCEEPYIALLSAHVSLTERDALEVAMTELDRDDLIAAVYLRQRTEGKSDRDFSSYESLFLRKRFPLFNIKMVADSIPSAPPISNAAAVIRRSIWEKESFPEVPASEDLLWARAVVEKGNKLFYVGERSIVHNHCETPEQIYRRVKINKIAQFGSEAQYFKALYYFFGILVGLFVLEHASLSVSLRYAKAHAIAYLR